MKNPQQTVVARPGSPADVDSLWQLLCSGIGRNRDHADPTAALRAVSGLLDAMGRPQQRLPVIHIAGSKGKGSTAIFCASLLRAAGLKTGLFISPHLSDWRERFQINGEFADPALLIETAAALRAAMAANTTVHPGFFDLATAAALWLFDRAGVDCAVIETGIGGRLDATNIVQPRACVITAIELEHRDRLGRTLAAIAGHKAGIIKPGVPVTLGPVPAAARKPIEQAALRQAAPLSIIEAAATDLGLPHACPHASLNATLALHCVAASGLVTPSRLARARKALGRTALPGRCEILRRDPLTIVDCAHTPASARALRQAIDGFGLRCRWVVSLKPDKLAAEILTCLLGPDDELILTCIDTDYAQSAHALSRHLPPDLNCDQRIECIDDPRHALIMAREALPATRMLCATGSVYLAGMARGIWRPQPSAGSIDNPVAA